MKGSSILISKLWYFYWARQKKNREKLLNCIEYWTRVNLVGARRLIHYTIMLCFHTVVFDYSSECKDDYGLLYYSRSISDIIHAGIFIAHDRIYSSIIQCMKVQMHWEDEKICQGRRGFEPGLTDLESGTLPLSYRQVHTKTVTLVILSYYCICILFWQMHVHYCILIMMMINKIYCIFLKIFIKIYS